MHHIHPTYRRITPEQLPTVTDLDGTIRPATDADLLNLGIVRVASDLYSCVHQERRQSDGSWAVVGEPHPGEELSRGLLPQRHATLPNDVRAQVLRAHIVESTETGEQVHRHIPMVEVTDAHTVLAEGLYPHRWHGEPER